jgi:histidine ammonia-lyase
LIPLSARGPIWLRTLQVKSCGDSVKIRTAAAVFAFLVAGNSAVAESYRPITAGEAGDTVTLTGHDLTLEQLSAIARQGQPVEISPEVRDHQADALSLLLEGAAEGLPVPGFGQPGPDSTAGILAAFENGAAPPGAPEVTDEALVRAAMAVRANTLIYQPVTMPVQQMLLDFLNDRITPVVAQPELSVTGPGPMANIAAAMVGRGDVYYHGIRMPAAQALSRAGLTAIIPADFDDHALIDTGAFEIARTALLAGDGRQALDWGDMIYAMDMDGLSASPAPLSLPAQANRPYQWLDWDAARILALLKGSYLFDGDPANPGRAYPDSLTLSQTRQGAAWQAWGALRDTVLVALNSSDQSPVFRVGLSPRESDELSTPQMMKYYAKGGRVSGGKRGYIVPAFNRDPYPLARNSASFTAALGDLAIAVARRLPATPAINANDFDELEHGLDALDRLLAADIANAASLMDARAAEDTNRKFGDAPAAVWAELRKYAPGGGTVILDFLRTRQAATYNPEAEAAPGTDAPIPLAQEKIHR